MPQVAAAPPTSSRAVGFRTLPPVRGVESFRLNAMGNIAAGNAGGQASDLPLIGVPRATLDALSAALANDPVDEAMLKALIEGRFHATPLAGVSDLERQLVGQVLDGLLPGVDDGVFNAWRDILETALRMSPRQWEAACLPLRPRLVAPEAKESPLLRSLHDALYRPFDLSREAWRFAVAQARVVCPEASARDIALARQKRQLGGLAQSQRDDWARKHLGDLAQGAWPETIDRGMKAIRRLQQKDRGLIDPRWGLSAVFEEARGRALDAPDRPHDIVAVFERLAEREASSAPSPTSAGAYRASNETASTPTSAERLLDVAHGAERDPERFDGPIGRYDTWANVLASVLCIPGGLEGFRDTVSDGAFALETAMRSRNGTPGATSRVAEATQGYVRQDGWMQRSGVPVDTADREGMAVRHFLDGQPRPGTALARVDQCRTERHTVPGLVVGRRRLINQFLARQGVYGDASGDAAQIHARRESVGGSAGTAGQPAADPVTSSGLRSHVVSPLTRAGALTDEGPRWPLPDSSDFAWGAQAAMPPASGELSRPIPRMGGGNIVVSEPALLSAQAWGKREMARFILEAFAEAMTSLDSTQQAAYLRAYRQRAESAGQLDGKMRDTLGRFEAEQKKAFSDFLFSKTGRRPDLDTTFITHTVMGVFAQRGDAVSWGSAIIDSLSGASPSPQAPLRLPDPKRAKRALGEWEPREVVDDRRTLWEAVKANFPYNHGGDVKSISLSDGGRAEDFIDAAREFDLGKRTREAMSTWLGDPLYGTMVQNALRDEFAFDALEALRDEENSGVTADRHRRLSEAFEQGQIHASPLQLRLDGFGREAALLPAFQFEVPRLPGASGMFIYFPGRPGGALRFYPDARSASHALRIQFVEGDIDSDTWLGRQLPIGARAGFFSAQKIKVKPQGLTWQGSKAYDLFNPGHGLRPKTFQIGETSTSLPFDTARIQAFRRRWTDVAFHSATTTGEQDSAGFMRSFNEVLNGASQLFMVSGIGGRVGKVVMGLFAAMAVKDLFDAAGEAPTTDGSSLAQAIENILTMAVSMGVPAGMERLARSDVDLLVAATDDQLLSTRSDGVPEFIRPDWDAYTATGNMPLSSMLPDRDGLIAFESKRFARLEKAGTTRLVEVEPVAGSASDRYRVVTADAALREMHVVYDHALGQWMPGFEDIGLLGDATLMARMLSRGEVSANNAGTVLDIAGVDRMTLEGIWSDTALTPSWLVEAGGRVRAHDELRALENNLAAGDGMAPSVADEVMAKLLADVTGRRVKIYRDGRLVEHSLPAGAPGRPIELVRLGENHYVPRDSAAPNQAVPGRFAMIDALVAADRTVGGDPAASNPGPGARRNVLGEQVLARVRSEPQSLYDYLLARRGLVARDASWNKKHFVSAPPADPVVTSLRRTYPALTDAVARDMAGSPEIRRRVLSGERDPDIDLLVARHAVHSRVQRAKEPLHYGSFTADGEALALSVWTRLPEWPRDVRVEVLEGVVGYGGEIVRTDTLLGAYGPADAGSTVRILRTEEGRYAGVDGNGEVLDEHGADGLPAALLASMTDAQRIRLAIDIFDSGALRQRGRDMAEVLDVDTLHGMIDREPAGTTGPEGKRCRRAPGDACGGSRQPLAGLEDNWMPSARELVAFRDEVQGSGVAPLVLPQNMVRDLLAAMHFRQPEDFPAFRQSVNAILQRGSAYLGLPDEVVVNLATLEIRNFASQVGNEPLNRGLAEFGYAPIRAAYKRSDIKSANKRYDAAVVGGARAAAVDARVAAANDEVVNMRTHNVGSAPNGGWSGTPWRNMQRVKKLGGGNCGELAAAVADSISLQGYRAETWQLMDGDHVFTVIGEPPALNVPGRNHVPLGQPHGFADPAWASLWVADAWLGILCPANEYAVRTDLKLTLWEAKGKMVAVADPGNPGGMIWALPDAAYRQAFAGAMSRSAQGGLVKLARQRWHDVLRQAGVPDAPRAPYVAALDTSPARQSTIAEQDAAVHDLKVAAEWAALDDDLNAWDWMDNLRR